MKKVLLSFFIIAAFAASSCAFAENAVNGENMKISVSDGKNKIVYEKKKERIVRSFRFQENHFTFRV